MQIEISKTFISKFGEFYNLDLADLASLAMLNFKNDDFDAVFVSNMLSPQLGISNLGVYLRSKLNLNVPVFTYNYACASGGFALFEANNALRLGRFNRILVLGLEKMTDFSANFISELLMSASNPDDENLFGFSFPSLYGIIANRYLFETKNDVYFFDKISANSHRKAVSNPNAQFQKIISTDDVFGSSVVSNPLKVLHSAPFSDGVSAVLLSATGVTDKPKLKDIEVGFDSLALSGRKSLVSFASVVSASRKIYSRNRVKIDEIDALELHDCFAIAEGIALEDLEFSDFGYGLVDAANEKFRVNLSGGLKACGHPVGATGVRQVAYLADLISAKESNIALAHNVAGTGSAASISLITSK